jgi:hypothetical protein
VLSTTIFQNNLSWLFWSAIWSMLCTQYFHLLFCFKTGVDCNVWEKHVLFFFIKMAWLWIVIMVRMNGLSKCVKFGKHLTFYLCSWKNPENANTTAIFQSVFGYKWFMNEQPPHQD